MGEQKTETPVYVSQEVGDGEDARVEIKCADWTLTKWKSDEDSEPRVRDVDLAVRLGYKRPRDIREFIERLIKDKEIANVLPRRAVRPGKLQGKTHEQIEVTEYWLTEVQVVLVTMHANTPKSIECRKTFAAVLVAVRRGLLRLPQSTSEPTEHATHSAALARHDAHVMRQFGCLVSKVRQACSKRLGRPVSTPRAHGVIRATLKVSSPYDVPLCQVSFTVRMLEDLAEGKRELPSTTRENRKGAKARQRQQNLAAQEAHRQLAMSFEITLYGAGLS